MVFQLSMVHSLYMVINRSLISLNHQLDCLLNLLLIGSHVLLRISLLAILLSNVTTFLLISIFSSYSFSFSCSRSSIAISIIITFNSCRILSIILDCLLSLVIWSGIRIKKFEHSNFRSRIFWNWFVWADITVFPAHFLIQILFRQHLFLEM